MKKTVARAVTATPQEHHQHQPLPPPSALRFVSFVCVCVRVSSVRQRETGAPVTCKTTERDKRTSAACARLARAERPRVSARTRVL